MNGLIIRYALIELIRVLNRAVFNTGGTTGTFILDNIARLRAQRDGKVSCGTFNMIDFSEGEDLYVGVPADLDQFGCEDSHGAIIGRKGFIQLGHVPADTRPFLYEVNLEARCGQI